MLISNLYRPLQPHEKLYFLHIQKTAGTTFTAILESYFENDEICPAYYLDDLLLLTKEKRQSYRFYRGHFSYNLCIFLTSPLVYITMLRHPVERVISNIRHIQRYPEHPDHKLVKSVDLISFVTHPQTQSDMSNLQTRMIAPPKGKIVNVFLGWAATRNDLELAKERLQEFPFFGLTEDFEHSMSLLAYTFGWSPVMNINTLNAAPTPMHMEDYPQAVMDAITEINQIDIELYDYARQLFQTRYNQMLFQLLDQHYSAHYDGYVPKTDESIVVDFTKRIPGLGWYPYEVGGKGGYRWTGPDRTSTLDLILNKSASYIVRLEVLSGVSMEVLKSLRLVVEDRTITLSVQSLPSGALLFQGLVSSNMRLNRVTRFSLCVDRTEKGIDLGINDDQRPLGIAISSFKLEPTLSNMSKI